MSPILIWNLMISKKNSTPQIKPSPDFTTRYFNAAVTIALILGFFTVRDYLSHLQKNFNNFQSSQNFLTTPVAAEETEVKINNQVITAEIADTTYLRDRGLSYRDSLMENRGMLFVFRPANLPRFWMKDMRFPLDIIWIDDDRVVDIDENLPNPSAETPLNQLPTYSPKSIVNYVLEVNAGYVAQNAIKIGDRVEINY